MIEGDCMNKIKYFVFSDVHGEYDALMDSLKEAGYDRANGTHQLISIGDAFDRGPNSRKVYNFLRESHAICVKGNHDEFFQEYLEKGMDGEFVLFNILHNGLGETIHSFTGLPDRQFDYKTVDNARRNIDMRILPWLQNMPLFYETQNFIFVHAGLDPNLPDWRMTDRHYMLWDIQDSHCPIPTTQKIVVIGHHHAFRVRQNGEAVGFHSADINDVTVRLNKPTGGADQTPIRSYGNKDEHTPYCYGNKIAIDGCTNLTGKVNVLVFEDYPLTDEQPVKEPEPTPRDEGTIHVTGTDGRIYATRGDIYMEPNEWATTGTYTYTTTIRR